MVRSAVAVLAWLIAALALAEPPPVSSFTDFPRYANLKISPGGNHLAFTQETADFESIAVIGLRDLKPMAHTSFGSLIGIQTFAWANDSRLLISPTRRFPGFTAAKVPTGEILGIDANGKQAELLFGPLAGDNTVSRLKRRESVFSWAEILETNPGEPGRVLIQTMGYGIEGQYNTVQSMDIKSGLLRKVATSPVRNGQFMTDADHRVTLVSGANATGNVQVHYRAADDRDWELKFDARMDQGNAWPVARAATAGSFYLLDDRDAETSGVFLWTPATGEHRLLFRHPASDASLAGVDPAGRAWAFRYVDHFPEYWYPDPEHALARLHQWLRQKFPGHDVAITSQTDDLKLAVARVSGPRTPGVFFVVDVDAQKILQMLESRPGLKYGDLAAVEPIEIVARDGLKVRGYLTMPNGTDGKKLPMIVLVHGGPHGPYDEYGFDYEAQLFASRGYVVLQVNYRGSGGRGRAFQSAGYGKWGREMQDDVTDAVRWAIQDGVADPKRICIYGGSYGAYSALTGVFREPDLYRCAVGMAGVYDLPLMFERGDIQTIERGIRYMRMAIGTDVEELKRRSPVYNADRIRVPVLLLHGKEDERAPYEHAKRLREALTRAGNPPEWSSKWGEFHGYFDETNRREAYQLILDFFARHLDNPA